MYENCKPSGADDSLVIILQFFKILIRSFENKIISNKKKTIIHQTRPEENDSKC